MKKFPWVLLVTLIAGALLGGCSKKEDAAPSPTGGPPVAAAQKDAPVWTAQQIRQEFGFSYAQDEAFAGVKPEWLESFYADWRAELHGKGVTKWEGRFDCSKFTMKFVADAHLRFYSEAFHSWTKAQALALGEFWYCPQKAIDAVAKGRPGRVYGMPMKASAYFVADATPSVTEWITSGHAIATLKTADGRRTYFEPQTGKFVTLTQQEIDSCFYRRF